jgi:hypothetical protein
MKKNQHTQSTPDEIIKRDENLWMKISTSIPKFWVWMKNNRHRQPTRDEIIKRDEIFGWNFPLPVKILGLDEK